MSRAKNRPRAEASKVMREMQGTVLHSVATAGQAAGEFATEMAAWNALLESPLLADAYTAGREARRALQRLDLPLNGDLGVPDLHGLTFRMRARDFQEWAESAQSAAINEVVALCNAAAALVDIAIAEAAELGEAADDVNGALDDEDAEEAEKKAAHTLEKLRGSEPIDDELERSWEAALASWKEARAASRKRRSKGAALKAKRSTDAVLAGWKEARATSRRRRGNVAAFKAKRAQRGGS